MPSPRRAKGRRRSDSCATMGALHQGHASLMSLARATVGTGPVVVSIFVNPMQFGAGEDLTRYPRTLSEDLALCEDRGVDLVYAPEVPDVYPAGEPEVMVDPGALGDLFEGRSRPGHFRGVLTVVAKLFGLVRPNVAVFGEKDYQQLALVRRMVADLCLGVEVIGAPTERETDGLAMSSRNRFLTPEQRQSGRRTQPSTASRCLGGGRGCGSAVGPARGAHRDSRRQWESKWTISPSRIPTSACCPWRSPRERRGRILVAAKLGSTRLIDNLPIAFG